MSDIPIVDPKLKHSSIQSSTAASLKNANLNGLAVNYAHSNEWFAYIPLENQLGKKYNNLTLHVTRFSLPQMEMQSEVVSFKGYQKEISNKVLNPGTKQLTIEYIVDSDWRNYKALYALMAGQVGNITSVTSEKLEPISPSQYFPLRIYLLDNYKKKIIQFCYANCWIKIFNDISLEQSNSEEVHASFTCCYDEFTIEDA